MVKFKSPVVLPEGEWVKSCCLLSQAQIRYSTAIIMHFLLQYKQIIKTHKCNSHYCEVQSVWFKMCMIYNDKKKIKKETSTKSSKVVFFCCCCSRVSWGARMVRVDKLGTNLFSPLLLTHFHSLQRVRVCPVRVKRWSAWRRGSHW